MRVAQIVPRIANEASGPSYSVPMLCESLADHGELVKLFVLGSVPSGDRPYQVEAFPSWSVPRRLGVSPALREALRQAAATTDIMHSNGLWMMPNVYPGGVRGGTGCRLVISPRGTLSPWAYGRSRWLKRILWNCGQRRTLERVDCFHVTAEHEAADVAQMGFRAPIAVIPNGIHLPAEPRTEPGGGRRRLLFFGRIHPTKGLDSLLPAWRRVETALPDWDLRIVGPDDTGLLPSLQRMARELGCKRVTFAGPAFGEAKAREFRSADLFVLPSRSENFGMAVAEALSYAVPAIVSKGAPWSGLADRGCGWWIDQGVEPLAAALEEALRVPGRQLHEMGLAGRAYMRDAFAWDRVARMMIETYRWVVGGGAVPGFVDSAPGARRMVS